MARSFPASAPCCSPCHQAAEPNSKPRVAGRGCGEGQAKLGVKLRAADQVWPGLPPPVEPEALAVPHENGGGLHEDEAGPLTRPDG